MSYLMLKWIEENETQRKLGLLSPLSPNFISLYKFSWLIFKHFLKENLREFVNDHLSILITIYTNIVYWYFKEKIDVGHSWD